MTRHRVLIALLILTAINTLNFFDRQILPAVQEQMRREQPTWGLSDAALGWLGTAFILLYALIGVPLGRLADVASRRKLLAAGVALWSLMTLGSGLAWSYGSLFLMRMGVGIGEAVCAPVASSLIGDLYPAGKRSRAMSVFMVGLPVGLALSFIVSSVIAKRWGWEMAFFVAGAPGLLLATVALFIHEPPRRDPNVISTPDSFRTSARAILILPTMWLIILSGALHNFNMYALGTFISSFLQRYHSLRIDEAGWVSGLVYGVGAVGIFAAGWLSDRAFRRGVRWRLHVAWGAILLSIPLLLAALHVPADHPWLCAAWLLPSMLLLYFYYGTVYASIQDVIPAPLRGLAMALYFCGMYVLGAVWGPAGFGWLSDLCARRAAALDGEEMVTAWHKAVGLHDAFYIVPLLNLALVLVLVAAAITIKRDHARTLAAR